ncbi:hypothetical protein PInf_021613 [Phytophthora infestans]|nr:hypothetical protein PInf_021613 [Phytophthora infestans]
MKTDKASSHSSRNKKKTTDKFDEVDKRIQIPMATRMKMQMNLKMNAIYRTLQHLNTTSSTRRPRGSADRAAERGVALIERKQFGAAIPYLTEALETLSSSTSDLSTKSSTVKLYHQRGLCYLASKKYKPAIEDLSRVMQMTPKSSELYAKRGKAYAALGEHHAAMLDYNQAISLAATQGLLNDCGGMEMVSDGLSSSASLVQLRGLYLARAKVYKAMNNITHALEDLSHAENSAGGHRDLELFYERAQLYLQCHQDPLALRDFDRFIELQEEAEESRHFDASGGVGGLAGFVAPKEMEAEPKARMLDVLLERAKLLQRLALEEDARERKDAELAAVEQGQSRSPNPAKSGSKLAYASVPPKPEPYRGIESRRLEKRALQDYSRALQLDPTNVETLQLRGESFVHLARYEDALVDFARALELDPHDFQVSMARARLYRQRGDLKGAVSEVTALRAQLYEELGAIKEAEKDYSSIIHAHFDKPGVDDATGKVTMELASGATITSEVAAHALLCRARLRLANEQFEAAEEDYQEILKSFANNMEAQLELQDTRERKVACEERKQREALAWLEQNADDMDGAGVLNTNGNVVSSKSKKKKKKKKKKASSSSAHDKPHVGYVLLEDEEELLQQEREEQQRREQEEKRKKVQGDEKDTVKDNPVATVATVDVAPLAELEQENTSNDPMDGELAKQTQTALEAAKSKANVSVDLEASTSDIKPKSDRNQVGREDKITTATTPPPPVVVANVMTRDEAWESMWDEEADEPLEAGAVRIQIQAQSDDVDDQTSRMNGACLSEHEKLSSVEDEEQIASVVLPDASNADEEANDEASGSSEDGKDSQGKAKAVLMDEKYLKKRERQLKKLRESLQQAADERDKSAIDEALARAERKQMSSALQEDIQRAQDVLANMAETQRRQEASSAESGRKHLHTVTSTAHYKRQSNIQQQLRAHQKLLEEKDAEIAKLKMLLLTHKDKASREDARSIEARTQAKAAALARRVTRLRSQFPVPSAAASQADTLIEWMGPSDVADRVRQQVLSFVQRVITAHFPLAAAPLFFATGSYPMKTYLPGSDLDICLLVPQELESSWYYIVTQALCVAGGSGGAGTVLDLGNSAIRNVTFINADVRVVKCTVDNIPVDFTANRVGALGAVRLLDAMAARVGRQHLFKKSLILIKAWCTHESSPFMQRASNEAGGSVPGSTPASVMGASHGALSTYAVNTIVMALFNQHGDALTHPLQALYLFLDRLAEFPWHECALTLHGPVPLSRLASTPLNGATSYRSKLKTAKLDASDVEAIRDTLADQFGAFDAALKSSKGTPTGLFPIRACNIVDPLDDKNNLARSVSAEGFPVMKRAFRFARDQLAAMLAPRSAIDDDAELLREESSKDVGVTFFSRCWQLYARGDGWRPDLLIHPRQIWHGKPASTSSTGSLKKNKASPRPQSASVTKARRAKIGAGSRCYRRWMRGRSIRCYFSTSNCSNKQQQRQRIMAL